ncbi:hypothetical protein [Erythrobacter litoralis]|uniref:Uncharacterized protein n=1 Tax=Erythrobacter litoralis (strain HTCC2594) TaxID=314225 RepID=Q2NAN9_ERYLH|nr:hypothetical protein [Erythrobacter litoralis]ABC63252.1 hypothetical protein ELI_05800 [Erythrobacter litoralis HTCC2594]
MSEAERQEIVADVKDAQIVPAEEISLDAIDFADIEQADIFGAGCNFLRPRVSGRSDLLFIGMEDIGAIKLNGRLQRLAPDKGSTKLPYLGWTKYDGTTHSVRLSLNERSGRQTGEEVTDYNGSITLRDGRDRIVFEDRGTVQCGA